MENSRPLPLNKDQKNTAGKLPISAEATTSWRAMLPARWCDAVEVPLYFEHHKEYEINARRSIGYDADDQPCFTAHNYTQTRLASDDDEEFYEVVAYAEQMAAWRMRDERWLIFRSITASQCTTARGFYSISPDMPR